MANTERLAVLKAVRESKSAVTSARFSPKLKAGAKVKLEKLYLLLDKVEDDLILSDITDRVAALEAASDDMAEIAADIKKAVKDLEAIAEIVDKAAKAIKVLVDIASKAGSLGL